MIYLGFLQEFRTRCIKLFEWKLATSKTSFNNKPGKIDNAMIFSDN